jgi:hypothetical protein
LGTINSLIDGIQDVLDQIWKDQTIYPPYP